MALSKVYTVASAFPNGVVDTDRLTQEIQQSAITVSLDYIRTYTGDCTVYFKAEPSSGEWTVLDGLVAVHSGEPFAVDAVTSDGRQIVRVTAVNTAIAFRPRAISFYTADPAKLHNINPHGVDYEDVTCKCYDADDDEITQAPYTGAVKTVIDFEPTSYYEMIGGDIDIPTSITGGTTDLWYGACIGVPDIPENYGGCIHLLNEMNLEADRDGMVRLDGRGVLGLSYSAQTHSNKIRFIFKHPAGESKRFQLLLEIFQ